MHVEIVAPALLAAQGASRHPALELLLARGRRQDRDAVAFEGALQALFGLHGEGFPAGALTALAAGLEPGAAGWLRADPVHLRLLRDRLVVVPAEALEISREEAGALAAAINRHFSGTLEVEVAGPRRWIARAAAPSHAEPALAQAGREVEAGDPLVNEIQMLLHAHPVNEAREARGEPAVNSLWLWGAGPLPSAVARWTSVVADDPVALGLARLAEARHGTLPATAAAWLERAPEAGRHLVVLDALRAPAAVADESSFNEELGALEAGWFVPLLAALRAGRLGMVTVRVPDAGATFETVRGDLRRFWRRPRPLQAFA